jgi:hypothetical protein
MSSIPVDFRIVAAAAQAASGTEAAVNGFAEHDAHLTVALKDAVAFLVVDRGTATGKLERLFAVRTDFNFAAAA